MTPDSRAVVQFLVPAEEGDGLDPGVASNSRITGALAAVLFVGLFVEGCTLLLGVGNLLVLHVFVGFLLVPPVLAKLGSTTFRMGRYYLNDRRYRRKGPPHPILRVLGPLVGISTVAVFATGIALVVVGRDDGRNLNEWHRLSFIVWVVLMTVHVLGHLVETARLSAADWLPGWPRVTGLAARRSLVVATLVAGLVLGMLSIGWTHDRLGGPGPNRVGLHHVHH